MSNFIKNCQTGQITTGLGTCLKELFPIKKPYLLLKNKTIDLSPSGELEEATYNELIQKGYLIDLGVVMSVEDLTIDPQTVDISRIPHKIGNAIYGVKINYKAYTCNLASLSTLENSKYELIWADKNGSLVGLTDDGLTLKGFNIESMFFNRLTILNTEDIGKSSISIYLSEYASKKLESSVDILDSSQIELELLDKQGIIDSTILSFSATEIKVVESCSQTKGIEGLTLTNFRILDNSGSLVVGATMTEIGDGVYSVSGVTGAVTIELYDSSINNNIIDYANEYYKSNKLAKVF